MNYPKCVQLICLVAQWNFDSSFSCNRDIKRWSRCTANQKPTPPTPQNCLFSGYNYYRNLEVKWKCFRFKSSNNSIRSLLSPKKITVTKTQTQQTEQTLSFLDLILNTVFTHSDIQIVHIFSFSKIPLTQQINVRF